MGTNITGDGQTELAFVQAILNYFSERLNKKTGAELQRKLLDWLKIPGNNHHVLFTHVKPLVAADVEKRLIKAKIPYLLINTPVGKTFLTRDTDKEVFLQIQQEVLSTRPEYYAACSVEQVLNRANNSKQQEMALIHLGTQAEAEEMIARINQEGKGIVATICHNPAKGAYEYDVLISSEDAIKKNGADTIGLELQWALKQSMRDIQDFRSDQASYDLNEIKIMLSELKKGHGVSIIDQLNTSNLRVDITPNGAIFKQRGKYGTWDEIRRVPEDNAFEMPVFDEKNPLYDTPENKQRLSQFEMALRAGIKDIHNIRVVDIASAERLCNRTFKQAKEDVEKIDSMPENTWKYGLENYDNYQFKTQLDPNRRTRPDFSRNTNATQQQKLEFAIYKAQGEAMINAVNEEAHRLAYLSPNFETASLKQKHQILSQTALRLLEEKELPAIREFLNINEDIPNNKVGTFVTEWYNNLISNFKDQTEADGINVEFINIRDIKAQRKRFQDYYVETEYKKERDEEQQEEKQEERENE